MRALAVVSMIAILAVGMFAGCAQAGERTELVDEPKAKRGTPKDVAQKEVADTKGTGELKGEVANFVGVYDQVPGEALAQARAQGKVADRKWTLTIRADGTFSQAVTKGDLRSVIRGEIELVGENLKRIIRDVDGRVRKPGSADSETLPLLVPSEGGKVLTEDTKSQKWVRRE